MIEEPKVQQRHFPTFSVIMVVIVSAGLWYYGASYYMLPFAERPESPLHSLLAPSAPVGRWLGIVGTVMMTTILLYMMRKKVRLLSEAGNIRLWLQVHIFMGLMGPVLITFHTGFKLGGLVAIAYWSMIITMLSGIFGRYIYIQIPRDTSGERLSRIHLEEEEQALGEELDGHMGDYPEMAQRIQRVLVAEGSDQASGFKAVMASMVQDASRFWEMRGLRKILRKHTRLDSGEIKEVARLVKRKAVLARRLAMIDTMEEFFHHWHVLHRPFVWIMFTIVVLHVGVAILFGYAT